MRLFRSWPLYAVAALILGYFLMRGDESPTEAPMPSAKQMETFNQRRSQPPPSAWRAPTPGAGYTYPNSDYGVDPGQSNLYRFRPIEPEEEAQSRLPPSYTFADRQGVYGQLPGRLPSEFGSQFTAPGQAGTQYRFRPQDQLKQSKRWSGNYPSPYPRGDYPAPQVPFGAARDSLWADTTPER